MNAHSSNRIRHRRSRWKWRASPKKGSGSSSRTARASTFGKASIDYAKTGVWGRTTSRCSRALRSSTTSGAPRRAAAWEVAVPWRILHLGSAWHDSLTDYLAAELGIDDLAFEDTLGVDSAPGLLAGENATFNVFHRFSSQSDRVRLRDDSRIATQMGEPRFQPGRATFSHPLLRDIAALALIAPTRNSSFSARPNRSGVEP